jgi:hypothetical protein
MSSVKVILALLNAAPALLSEVPAERVFAGAIPMGTVLPAISVMEVSAVEQGTINAQAPTTLVQAMVQVTVATNSYPLQKKLLDLARKACNYQRGQIKGVPVVSVRRLSNGPDFNDPDAGFYTQSVDFAVTYHEAN